MNSMFTCQLTIKFEDWMNPTMYNYDINVIRIKSVDNDGHDFLKTVPRSSALYAITYL